MIGIFAAYGFTGSLIAREFSRAPYDLRLIGRSLEKLKPLAAEMDQTPELVQADAREPAEVARAVDGLTVLINCAGPFSEMGEGVLCQAVNRHVNYLDTTGEQSFIRLALEKYGPIAGNCGLAIVPACAFEYALGDTAVALAAEPFRDCDAISVAYKIAGFGSSRGTKKSILRALGERGYARKNGAAIEISNLTNEGVDFDKEGMLPGYPFPGGEVFMSPLHVSVRDLSTFMVFPGPGLIVQTVNRMLPVLNRGPLGFLASWLADRSQFGPDQTQREATKFRIRCEARSGGDVRTVMVEGRDPYGLTAKIASAIGRLLHDGKAESSGGLSPAMVAGPHKIVDLVSAEGVTFSVRHDL
ncbi:MAG TPA: hypothetical protein VEZ90_16560 [Blastocatellia bacterium]|nr:hypothetical protein [Blastocatellia bacterium]